VGGASWVKDEGLKPEGKSRGEDEAERTTGDGGAQRRAWAGLDAEGEIILESHEGKTYPALRRRNRGVGTNQTEVTAIVRIDPYSGTKGRREP